MAATTEVSSLAEAREAAFDAAADLRALGRAHEAALARILTLEQESLVRRPALDAALVKLVAGAEWKVEAQLTENVRALVFAELPSHVADELRSRAGDVATLEVLRRVAAALPDSAVIRCRSSRSTCGSRRRVRLSAGSLTRSWRPIGRSK
jgi:hypothetical protein